MITKLMRIGWEIPNPINALNPNEATRFPFALVEPSNGLPTTYNVTVTVTDEDGEVEGAKVTLGGQTATTNASGIATFKSQANTEWTYSVKKAGYTTKLGEVSVESGASSVEVTLKKSTIARK